MSYRNKGYVGKRPLVDASAQGPAGKRGYIMKPYVIVSPNIRPLSMDQLMNIHAPSAAFIQRPDSGVGPIPVSENPQVMVVRPNNHRPTNGGGKRRRLGAGPSPGSVLSKAAKFLFGTIKNKYGEIERAKDEFFDPNRNINTNPIGQIENGIVGLTPQFSDADAQYWNAFANQEGGKRRPRKGRKLAAGSHPGFDKVAKRIARKQHIRMENAKAILAASSRHASRTAKCLNPKLKRVK